MKFLKENKWLLFVCLFVIVIYSLIIWFVGPLIAIADFKILKPVSYRLIAIILGLITVLVIGIYRFYKKKKQSGENQVSEIDGKLSKVKLESRLKEKFRHLDIFLQRQKDIKKRSLFQTIFGSKQDYIYDKPWFLLVGSGKTGKTSTLLNANLTFPIGTIDQNKIGGKTQDCDYFLTDDALFLDTAGHYFEEIEDQEIQKEWNDLLKNLKEIRPKQPINGLVLMLSVDEILQNDEEEIQKHINRIRLRLREIQAVFNTSFPLYIVINKIDEISGFSQFFKYLSDHEKKLAFGVSLDPLANDSNKKLDELLININNISNQLNKNIFKTISYNNHHDEEVDLAIGFSSQFNNFSEKLKKYLKKLLILSSYDMDLQLAGINFTSVLQQNNPYLKIKEGNSTESNINFVDNKTNINPFFLENLFKKLILSTAKMAGIDNNWLNKRKKIYWVIFSLLFVSAIFVFILLMKGYFFNRDYQKDAEKTLVNLEVAVNDVDVYHVPSVLNFINRLDKLPISNIDKEKLSRSFYSNYGLSQHDNIVDIVDSKNNNLINEILLPAISNEIYSKLRGSVESRNYNSAYADLKIYLMLYEKEHYDEKYIYQWVVNNVVSKSIYDDEVLKLVNNIFKNNKIKPQNDFDEVLVRKARQLLVYTDISQVILEDLNKHVQALPPQSMPLVSYISMGGISANNIFRRGSDKTLNDPINVVYTKYGYQNIFKPFVTKRLNIIYNEEKWVIGSDAQFKSIDDVMLDIYRLYSTNYINSWRNYLNDIQMIKPNTLQHAITMSKQLSERNSSLAGIIKGISLNTNYSVNDESSKSDRNPSKLIANKAVNKNGAQKKIIIDEMKIQGYLENISNSFSQFRNLTAGDESASHLNDITKSINDLYIYLLALEFSIQSEDQLLPDVKPLINYKAQINRLPEPFKPMLDVFVGKVIASSQSYKDGQLVAIVKQQDQIIKDSCRDLTLNKYPFSKSSENEISIKELGQIYGKNGLYLTAYNADVQVTNGQKIPYKILLEQGLRDRLVTYKNLENINSLYFQGGDLPKINFVARVKTISKNAEKLNIYYGGKKIDYFHGPIKNYSLVWPLNNDNNFILELTLLNKKIRK